MVPAKVNYIRHLSSFFAQVRQDDRLKANHVSLYLALFQQWNLHQFRQGFPVTREDVLQLCRIGSLNTYTRCLRDLHAFGYIIYQPSPRRYASSLISLICFGTPVVTVSSATQLLLFEETPRLQGRSFDTQHDHAKDAICRKNEPHMCRKNDTQCVAKLRCIYNKHINNNKTEREDAPAPIKKNNKANGAVAAADGYAPGAPSGLPAVKAFFSQHRYSVDEAMKFYHHYQANGWKQAGKTPISDWQAAAHKWVLNIHDKNHSDVYRKSQSTPTAGRLHSNPDKDYSDPL